MLGVKIASAVGFVFTVASLIIASRVVDNGNSRGHSFREVLAGIAIIPAAVTLILSALLISQHAREHQRVWVALGEEGRRRTGDGSPATGGVPSRAAYEESVAVVVGAPSASSSLLADTKDAWSVAIESLEERRAVVRLILLVPCFTIFSLLALWIPSRASVFIQMNELYESVTAFVFWQLIIIFCSDEVNHRVPPATPSDVAEASAQSQFGTSTPCATPATMGSSSYSPHVIGLSKIHVDETAKGIDGEEGVSAETAVTLRAVAGLAYATQQWQMWVQSMQPACECCACGLPLLQKAVNAPGFIRFLRKALVVYVVANILLIPIIAVCEAENVLVEGSMSFDNAYLYLNVYRLVFIVPAVIGIVMALMVVRRPLVHRSPVKKFITVKVLVVIGFWQRTILSLLERGGHLFPSLLPSTEAVAMMYAYLLICECSVLAFVNREVFPNITNDRWVQRLTGGTQTTSAAPRVHDVDAQRGCWRFFFSIWDALDEAGLAARV